jgi:hypothetical protein
VEHDEVPKEETIVEIFEALKEWYGIRHLAVRCCSQPKKWTQSNDGSRKKLATAIPFVHNVRDSFVRDKARTRLLQEPRKEGHSGRDGQNWKASTE